MTISYVEQLFAVDTKQHSNRMHTFFRYRHTAYGKNLQTLDWIYRTNQGTLHTGTDGFWVDGWIFSA